MRSFVLIGALVVVVSIIFFRGYAPQPAGATGSSDAAGDTSTIRFEYADFEDEGPLTLPPRRPTVTAPKPGPETVAVTPPTNPSPANDPTTLPDPDLPSEPDFDAPPPTASAGKGVTIWLGDGELILNGTASQGDVVSYFWRQVSGPNDLQIQDPTAAQTVARGFSERWTPGQDFTYEFELTVTDAAGRQAVSTVTHCVKVAPELRITPAPKHNLAYRDGYLLAHFEAWKTNRSDDADSFEIHSPTALTFHHLSGDSEFDITVEETGGAYAYRIAVFYADGINTSWLEFFLDTPQRIPAVLQIGVNWE